MLLEKSRPARLHDERVPDKLDKVWSGVGSSEEQAKIVRLPRSSELADPSNPRSEGYNIPSLLQTRFFKPLLSPHPL